MIEISKDKDESQRTTPMEHTSSSQPTKTTDHHEEGPPSCDTLKKMTALAPQPDDDEGKTQAPKPTLSAVDEDEEIGGPAPHHQTDFPADDQERRAPSSPLACVADKWVTPKCSTHEFPNSATLAPSGGDDGSALLADQGKGGQQEQDILIHYGEVGEVDMRGGILEQHVLHQASSCTTSSLRDGVLAGDEPASGGSCDKNAAPAMLDKAKKVPQRTSQRDPAKTDEQVQRHVDVVVAQVTELLAVCRSIASATAITSSKEDSDEEDYDFLDSPKFADKKTSCSSTNVDTTTAGSSAAESDVTRSLEGSPPSTKRRKVECNANDATPTRKKPDQTTFVDLDRCVCIVGELEAEISKRSPRDVVTTANTSGHEQENKSPRMRTNDDEDVPAARSHCSPELDHNETGETGRGFDHSVEKLLEALTSPSVGSALHDLLTLDDETKGSGGTSPAGPLREGGAAVVSTSGPSSESLVSTTYLRSVLSRFYECILYKADRFLDQRELVQKFPKIPHHATGFLKKMSRKLQSWLEGEERDRWATAETRLGECRATGDEVAEAGSGSAPGGAFSGSTIGRSDCHFLTCGAGERILVPSTSDEAGEGRLRDLSEKVFKVLGSDMFRFSITNTERVEKESFLLHMALVLEYVANLEPEGGTGAPPDPPLTRTGFLVMRLQEQARELRGSFFFVQGHGERMTNWLHKLRTLKNKQIFDAFECQLRTSSEQGGADLRERYRKKLDIVLQQANTSNAVVANHLENFRESSATKNESSCCAASPEVEEPSLTSLLLGGPPKPTASSLSREDMWRSLRQPELRARIMRALDLQPTAFILTTDTIAAILQTHFPEVVSVCRFLVKSTCADIRPDALLQLSEPDGFERMLDAWPLPFPWTRSQHGAHRFGKFSEISLEKKHQSRQLMVSFIDEQGRFTELAADYFLHKHAREDVSDAALTGFLRTGHLAYPNYAEARLVDEKNKKNNSSGSGSSGSSSSGVAGSSSAQGVAVEGLLASLGHQEPILAGTEASAGTDPTTATLEAFIRSAGAGGGVEENTASSSSMNTSLGQGGHDHDAGSVVRKRTKEESTKRPPSSADVDAILQLAGLTVPDRTASADGLQSAQVEQQQTDHLAALPSPSSGAGVGGSARSPLLADGGAPHAPNFTTTSSTGRTGQDEQTTHATRTNRKWAPPKKPDKDFLEAIDVMLRPSDGAAGGGDERSENETNVNEALADLFGASTTSRRAESAGAGLGASRSASNYPMRPAPAGASMREGVVTGLRDLGEQGVGSFPEDRHTRMLSAGARGVGGGYQRDNYDDRDSHQHQHQQSEHRRYHSAGAARGSGSPTARGGGSYHHHPLYNQHPDDYVQSYRGHPRDRSMGAGHDYSNSYHRRAGRDHFYGRAGARTPAGLSGNHNYRDQGDAYYMQSSNRGGHHDRLGRNRSPRKNSNHHYHHGHRGQARPPAPGPGGEPAAVRRVNTGASDESGTPRKGAAGLQQSSPASITGERRNSSSTPMLDQGPAPAAEGRDAHSGGAPCSWISTNTKASMSKGDNFYNIDSNKPRTKEPGGVAADEEQEQLLKWLVGGGAGGGDQHTTAGTSAISAEGHNGIGHFYGHYTNTTGKHQHGGFGGKKGGPGKRHPSSFNTSYGAVRCSTELGCRYDQYAKGGYSHCGRGGAGSNGKDKNHPPVRGHGGGGARGKQHDERMGRREHERGIPIGWDTYNSFASGGTPTTQGAGGASWKAGNRSTVTGDHSADGGTPSQLSALVDAAGGSAGSFEPLDRSAGGILGRSDATGTDDQNQYGGLHLQKDNSPQELYQHTSGGAGRKGSSEAPHPPVGGGKNGGPFFEKMVFEKMNDNPNFAPIGAGKVGGSNPNFTPIGGTTDGEMGLEAASTNAGAPASSCIADHLQVQEQEDHVDNDSAAAQMAAALMGSAGGFARFDADPLHEDNHHDSRTKNPVVGPSGQEREVPDTVPSTPVPSSYINIPPGTGYDPPAIPGQEAAAPPAVDPHQGPPHNLHHLGHEQCNGAPAKHAAAHAAVVEQEVDFSELQEDDFISSRRSGGHTNLRGGGVSAAAPDRRRSRSRGRRAAGGRGRGGTGGNGSRQRERGRGSRHRYNNSRPRRGSRF